MPLSSKDRSQEAHNNTRIHNTLIRSNHFSSRSPRRTLLLPFCSLLKRESFVSIRQHLLLVRSPPCTFARTTARALKSRMTPPSWALLARNIPNKRRAPPSSSPAPPAPSSDVAFATTAPSAAAAGATAAPAATTVVRSLSHEVCHRLLMDRFLSQTSYADAETDKEIQGVSQSSSGGLKRALRALQVLLDDEDDLLEVSACEDREAFLRRVGVCTNRHDKRFCRVGGSWCCVRSLQA